MVAWIRFPAQMLQALWALVELVRAIVERISSHTELEKRLSELERTRALWETSMEAALARAEEQFKAARRTEERTRNMTRRAEEEADDDEADTSAALPADWQAAVNAHAAASGAAAVPPVHSRMADREAARARKWGR